MALDFHSVLTSIVLPICSTYGIFTNICPKNHPNVGKYTIHGAFGLGMSIHKSQRFYDVNNRTCQCLPGKTAHGSHGQVRAEGGPWGSLIFRTSKWCRMLKRVATIHGIINQPGHLVGFYGDMMRYHGASLDRISGMTFRFRLVASMAVYPKKRISPCNVWI